MTAPPRQTNPAQSPFTRRRLFGAAGWSLGAAAVAWPLAGCTTGDTDRTGQGPKGIEGVEPKQLGTETPGVLYADGYVGPRASVKERFGDGSTVFRVVVGQDATVVGDWNKNNKMTEWMEQRTGVKVEFVPVLTTASDGSTDMTKVNAMLASGDLPDAFMGLPFSNDQISLYGQQGIFQPLDDLIATYAPEMRRMLAEYPGFAGLTLATDGKTYQFAGINDCYHCWSSPGRAWINTSYLDKVGAKMPTTTDELRAVLKEFKANDPSPKKNIIPFGSSVGDQVDQFVMNAFLYNPGGDINGGWLALNQGKVEFVAAKDEWREALRYLCQLFDDGTVTRQTFTMTSDTMLQAGNQGRFGFIRAYYWGSFADITYREDSLWRQYAAVPPLKGPGGHQTARWDHYGYRSGTMLVTKDCQQPEIMVQWADAQMELEAIMRGYGGEKGNWDWSAQGAKGINDQQALYSLKTWPAPKSTSWNQYSLMYRSNDFRLGQEADPVDPTFEYRLQKEAEKYEPFAVPQDQQLPPLIFDESAAAAKADTAASVYQAVRQGIAQFAVGEKNINDDGDWSAYTSSFDAMGMSNYLDLYQQAYDQRPQ